MPDSALSKIEGTHLWASLRTVAWDGRRLPLATLRGAMPLVNPALLILSFISFHGCLDSVHEGIHISNAEGHRAPSLQLSSGLKQNVGQDEWAASLCSTPLLLGNRSKDPEEVTPLPSGCHHHCQREPQHVLRGLGPYKGFGACFI